MVETHVPKQIDVARVDMPKSWPEFRDEILAARKPVVFDTRALVEPALENWRVENMLARYADVEILVDVSPLSDNTVGELRSAQTRRVRFRDYVEYMKDPSPKEVWYYGEKELFNDLPGLQQDVTPLPFLPPELVFRQSGFLGSRTQHTGAHFHGWGEACVTEIVGTKRMWLWDEADIPKLHPRNDLEYHNWSEINFRSKEPVDIERFPEYANVEHYYEVELEPGDTLYIPTMCFHVTWYESDQSFSWTHFWLTDPDVFTLSPVHWRSYALIAAKFADRVLADGNREHLRSWLRSFLPNKATSLFGRATNDETGEKNHD